MALDPDIARFLAGPGRQLAFPAQAREDPDAAAAYLANARAALAAPPSSPREPVCEVYDTDAAGVPVRVYRAAEDAPLLVYFHGGGWVSGGLEMNDVLCRRLANLTACVLVSVDYRLAPEHPYPAALDDCLAAVAWARKHISGRHVSVGGTSAGGNLAAGVALASRDRGLPPFAAQLLIYPVLDPSMDTPSYADNGTGYLLERSQLQWYWDQYLSARNGPVPPYAAPIRASDLAGLPRAVVVTAEYDPLRDEGERYAARLAAAGVPARTMRFDGQIHGFLTFLHAMPAAATALEQIAAAVRDAWR
jgi:acetyl esterase